MKASPRCWSLFSFFILVLVVKDISSFQSRVTTNSRALALYAEDKTKEYSRELYLREEAESPFRKVRFFFYIALGGGALTSLAVSGARVAAGLAGINTDLLEQSATNMAIDTAGLVLLAFLYQRDLKAEESRLERASKGAALAQLKVRGSKALIEGEEGSETFTTSLASLRRGRGIEKRVVIAAAGPEKIAAVVRDAKRLSDSLDISDLLVVPVVLPAGVAPEFDTSDEQPVCIAFPVGSNWKIVVDDEAKEATNQGVDVQKEGFCIVLKKNGRVGQRTRGVFLDNMVGEVEKRRGLGMDVTNI